MAATPAAAAAALLLLLLLLLLSISTASVALQEWLAGRVAEHRMASKART
jgi:hypothetical protein